MQTVLLVLGILLGVVGIIGSVVPGLPGPPLSWIGVLLMFFRGGIGPSGDKMSLVFLLVWLGIVIIISVLDYVVPSYFTKLTGGSKYAGWGAIIGLFLGLIVPPVGMILGSLLGAFLFELVFGQKGAVDSVKSAFGAFLGFLFGTGAKLICSGIMMYYIIVYI